MSVHAMTGKSFTQCETFSEKQDSNRKSPEEKSICEVTDYYYYYYYVYVTTLKIMNNENEKCTLIKTLKFLDGKLKI